MSWLILILALAGPPLVAGAVLSTVRPDWVVRISTGSMVTQVGLVLISWLLLATLPGRTNWSGAVGDTCPNLDAPQGIAVIVIAFATLAVGGIAAGSSTVSVLRRAAKPGRVAAGLGADGLTVAVWVPIVATALCGMN
jgi:hypothetical protein